MVLLACALYFVSGLTLHAQTYGLPVVPGGQGYGMQTRAAYGGLVTPLVYRVTNRNDTGAGSLRAAMEATVPRVVVFEVSGYIDLADTIRITSPYITVAGQTAPSPGITLRKYGLEVQTHDVLLQHFAIRPGEWGQGKQDNCGLIAYGVEAHDIVLDHLSVSWGPDENIAADTYYGGDMNMTVWRSISAEGLDFPTSVPASASHGVLVQANSRKVYIAQSLMASNRERNPYAQSDTSVAAVNNLIYNWFANWAFFFANFTIVGDPGGRPWTATVVGNRLIPGPNTDDDSGSPQGWLFYYDNTGIVPAGNQIYRADNTVDNSLGIPMTTEGNEMAYDPNVSAPPPTAPLAGVTPMTSDRVEAFVLANAGARPADRDAVDRRIVSSVTARTSVGYIASQSKVGGYPALAANVRTLTLPADPNGMATSGYTHLEEWLHLYAALLEGGTVPPPVPPSWTCTVQSVKRINAGTTVTTRCPSGVTLTAGQRVTVTAQ
jgi:hypothetical protein